MSKINLGLLTKTLPEQVIWFPRASVGTQSGRASVRSTHSTLARRNWVPTLARGNQKKTLFLPEQVCNLLRNVLDQLLKRFGLPQAETRHFFAGAGLQPAP
jgi:hypothetical protein